MQAALNSFAAKLNEKIRAVNVAPHTDTDTLSFDEIVKNDKPLKFEIVRSSPLLVSADGKNASRAFDANRQDCADLDSLIRYGKTSGYVKKIDRMEGRELNLTFEGPTSNRTIKHDDKGYSRIRLAALNVMARNVNDKEETPLEYGMNDIDDEAIAKKEFALYNLLHKFGWFNEEDND